MSDLKHECAVAAVYHRLTSDSKFSALLPNHEDPYSAAALIPRMLLDMQNRGQLASGMTSYNADRSALLRTHKELGTVTEGFRLNHRQKFEAIMERQAGRAAIGHVRYATCGGDDKSYAQPFERDHGRKAKWFAFAFNGQITNFNELRKRLLDEGGYHLKRETDTEIIQHVLSYELQNEDPEPDWVAIFGRLAERFDGAYNIVLINAAGDLVVARDPVGFRPLCFAEDGPLFAAASESVPLANIGFQNIRSLDPGHLLIVNDKGVRIERYASNHRHAHCFFEWIYFANVASTLDDCSVYLSRTRLGKELAALEDLKPDPDTIVVPVPDTAKAAADAMAFALGVPSLEGVIRNRFLGRTFIEGASDRATKVRLKYTPLREVLEGKRVILVEDSIVRSTTLRALVGEIKKRGGAREVHLRIACPPIIAPCYYGIDMSTRRELIAPKYADLPDGGLSEAAQKKLAQALDADSLRYLPPAALARSIGLSEDSLCRACVTGDYPTPCGDRLFRRISAEPIEIELATAAGLKSGGRAYEN